MLGLGNLLSKGKVLGFPNKYSFNFDGSDDYLETQSKLGISGSNAFTMSAWIKLDHLDANQTVIFSGEISDKKENLLVIRSSNKVGWNNQGSNDFLNSSGTTISADTWYHIAVTFNGSDTIKIYLNGSLDGSKTDCSSVNITDTNFMIGQRTDGLPFDGNIDEVAVWNSELSASTIAKLGSKPVDLTKYSASNLKLWLRAGDKVLPEEDTSIARSDFHLDFDGTNDYVLASSTGLTLNDLSVMGWFTYIDNGESYQGLVTLVDTGDDYTEGLSIHFHNSNNYLRAEGASISGASSKASANTIGDGILINSWNHFAYTVDRDGGSNNAKLYVNGILSATNTAVDNATKANNIYIGSRYYSSAVGNFHEGKISNVSVYQTVLDAQTIKQFAKSRYTPMRDNRFSVVDFDGTNDSIVASTTLDGTYTISAWVNLSATGSNSYIVDFRTSGGTGYWLFNTSNPSAFNISSGTSYVNGSTGTTITTGAWNHVVVSGITVESSVASIGRANDGNYATWGGSMSSVSIYSGTKSAEEVYALYSKGITYDESSESDLQHYYRMGDDTSKAYPTIADSSSNSNDGTITNGASDDIVQQMVAGYDMGAFESSSEELNGESFQNESFETWDDVDTINWWTHRDENNGGSGLISQVGSGESLGGSGTGSVHFSGGGNKQLTTPQNILNNNTLYKFIANVSRFEQGTLRLSLATNGNVDLTSSNIINNQIIHYFVSGGSNYHYLGLAGAGTCDFTLDSVSLKEVLQSDLSDTHPAIIDVNEPVAGAELSPDLDFTLSGTQGASTTGTYWTTGANTTIANGKVTKVGGGSGSINSTNEIVTQGKLYQATVVIDEIDEQPIRVLFSGTGQDHYIYGTGTHTVYGVALDANEKVYINFGYHLDCIISSFSIKEVLGNVGTMTNQDSADLVYSSVLPDQSFLTGVNSAYNFIDLDGSDEYIDCGDGTSLDTTSAMSFSMWFKRDGTSTDHLASRDDTSSNRNWSMYVYSNNINFDFLISGAGYGLAGSSTLSADTWYHVTFTHDGSNQAIYVNGSSENTSSRSGSIDNDDVSLYLGRRASVYFNGKIGQTALWNKALSSTEVGAIYTLGRHGNLLDSYSDNLVGNWAMSSLDSKTGLSDVGNGTIYDRSGNSNHGTATNTEASDLASSPNATPNGYSSGDTNRSSTKP